MRGSVFVCVCVLHTVVAKYCGLSGMLVDEIFLVFLVNEIFPVFYW